ncbi:MAG: right-handed parallel beta-helix repeat-containing protein [Bacteroidales bacterium]|nr:right-handed parallel beta-helix repeat-containing protein [Bacteroidales bacterium]
MKTSKILFFVFVLLLLFRCSSEKIANNALFIAPLGNDSWSGKLAEPNKNETDGPYATFQKAQETIRELKKTGKLPAVGITVYVREGNYSISKAIKLTTEDSGEKNAPITWRSYPGERVVFSGGKTISGFTKIKDAEILKRIEKPYHDSILVCDPARAGLKPMELTFHSRKPLAMELFFNGKAMTLARYPNEGWLKIATVPQFGTELIYEGNLPHKRFDIPVGRHYGRFTYESNRPEYWQTEDIWMHGYWSWDWSETYNKIEKIDTEKKEIYPAAPYNGTGYTKGQRFYFLNVLEELDSPGEYYINRKTGKLYFFPPENINKAEVTVSVMEEPFFVLENTSYLNIEAITFKCSRTTAVRIIGGNSNKIAGCVFRNLGNTAVIIDSGKKNGILSCDIYGIAGCGIQLTGGDRKTLTPANNYAENNHIYNFGRVFRTYSPAISMNGVGNRLSHNYIHDSPHAGVLFGGNEHILEFNEIHDIAKETGDVGAFYIGRDWTCRGNIIRYNYFHHLFGPGLHGVRAVYLDDFTSGTTIFGNVFYKAGRAAFIGGGRDNVIENNIFVECEPSVQVDARGLSWAKYFFDKSSKIHVSTLFDGMDAVNFNQPPYSEKYPKLLALYDDDPAVPKNNKVIRNVSFGGRFIDLYDGVNFEIIEVKNNLIGDTIILRESQETDQSDNFQIFQYGHVETMEKMKGNKFSKENPGFEDIAKEKFQLNDNSPAYKLGFKKIPIEKIGLYNDEYRTRMTMERR